jgi:NADPH2:quinone reductase
MKAQLLQTYGDTPDFRLADIDVPAIKPGHVLVRVAATSVNPIDIKIRKMKPAFAPALPAILGMDVAGTALAVGEGVSGLKPGDEVFGCAGGLADMPGALAEYMLADARLLALKPANLTMAQAAALPLVTITAWDALFDRARIKAGQFVLVHAGTGGVGHVAVQLAKSCGARVATTVSSADKANLARSLGADEIINYREEKPEEYVARLTGGRGFDVVFDTVGGANLDASFLAAGQGGTVVSTNTRSTHDLSSLHAKALTLSVVFMLLPLITGQGRERHGEIMAQAAALAQGGELGPHLDRIFPLEDIAKAHDFLDSGRAVGKVVIQVA